MNATSEYYNLILSLYYDILYTLKENIPSIKEKYVAKLNQWIGEEQKRKQEKKEKKEKTKQ